MALGGRALKGSKNSWHHNPFGLLGVMTLVFSIGPVHGLALAQFQDGRSRAICLPETRISPLPSGAAFSWPLSGNSWTADRPPARGGLRTWRIQRAISDRENRSAHRDGFPAGICVWPLREKLARLFESANSKRSVPAYRACYAERRNAFRFVLFAPSRGPREMRGNFPRATPASWTVLTRGR